MSDEECYESLVAMVHAIESIGGSPHYHACLIDDLPAKLAEEAPGYNKAKKEEVVAAATTQWKGSAWELLSFVGPPGSTTSTRQIWQTTTEWVLITTLSTSGAQAVDDMSNHISFFALGCDAERCVSQVTGSTRC
eukprot:scaffold1561_cov129-Skeletonema_menzelii.AAC.17